MSTEQVFCPTCMEVTACRVDRDYDYIAWTCLKCGKVADEDQQDIVCMGDNAELLEDSEG